MQPTYAAIPSRTDVAPPRDLDPYVELRRVADPMRHRTDNTAPAAEASDEAPPALVAAIDETRSWEIGGENDPEHGDASIPPPETHALTLDAIEPRCVAVKLPRVRPKTTGFLFPEGASWIPPKPESGESEATSKRSPPKRSRPGDQRTRIRPPQDVVKLQDRLYY